MKQLIILLLISTFIFSCTKSDLVKPSNVSASDNSEAITAKNAFALLTAHTWIYSKYYTSSDGVGTGVLAYKRGRANNSLVLDNNTVKFNADGTVDEFTNDGTYVPGRWTFTNEAKTSMSVTNSYGTFNSNIKLSATKYIWSDPVVNKTSGIMVPQP